LCGIAGILFKNASSRGVAPIGKQLISMTHAMRHRGVDGTGVTICGEDLTDDYLIRIWITESGDPNSAFPEIESRLKTLGSQVNSSRETGRFVRYGVSYNGDIKALANALMDIRGVEIHSIGTTSEVVKDVGDALELDKRHNISSMKGTHGIGHVRLATESRVDISHSHPFWAYPFPDITVVHNGQLTNYHKMKRMYEQRGFRFQTQNDSEVIAVYIGDKLSQGWKLEDALKESLNDIDGTFTYLVTTSSGIGVAKDRWCTKPLVVMERDDVVAVASEEWALRTVFREEIERLEPQENEYLTWSIGKPVMVKAVA